MATPSHYGHLAPTFDTFKNFINGTVDVGSNPGRALFVLAHDGIGIPARYPTGITVGGVAMNATAVEVDGTNSIRYVGYWLTAAQGLGTGVLPYTLAMATPVDNGSPVIHGEVMNDVSVVGTAVKSAGFSGSMTRVVPTSAGQVVLSLSSLVNNPVTTTPTAPSTEVQDIGNQNYTSHSMVQTATGASTTLAASLSPNSVWLGFAWALTGTAAAPTSVTINSGPSGGTVGVASSNFVVGTDNPITSGAVVVTPSAGAGGGTFTPATVTLSAGSPTGTFTYTPASAGAKTISFTNGAGLTNPASLTYTATATGPTFTVQPTNTTVAAPAAASFTATATGTGTITYQLQRQPAGGGGYANVSGAGASATAASGVAVTLTTGATAQTGGSHNNGDTYRIQASDSSGGPNSSSVVTLTVTAAALSITSSPLSWDTGSAAGLHLGAPFTAYVSNPSTGALVVKKTGLTSHASTGVCTFSDGALTAVPCRVIWQRTDTGDEGLETLTPA